LVSLLELNSHGCLAQIQWSGLKHNVVDVSDVSDIMSDVSAVSDVSKLSWVGQK